jgi:hypothetical protein
MFERREDAEAALSIQVLTMSAGRIRAIAGFVGAELFPAFGLPSTR